MYKSPVDRVTLTAMSQYTYLSKLDPEFAAFLEQNCDGPRRLPPPDDIAAAQKPWTELSQAPFMAPEKARLYPG